MKQAAIYLRVSTAEQSVDSQLHDTQEQARRRGYEATIFKDTISGASTRRAGLDSMMAEVRRGKLDAVFCYKLDRLGRSLAHLAQVVKEFEAHGVALICPGQGIDTSNSNPAARLQMNVLLAVAEFERDIIRERTVEGLRAARRKGVRLGRPRGVTEKQKRLRKRAGALLEENPTMSCPRLARELGCSTGTAHAIRKDWRLT